MDRAAPQYSTVFMPAVKSWQQWERPLSPVLLTECQEMPRVSSDVLPPFSSLKLHDETESFFSCEDAPLFLHSAPGEISHLSPQNTMSPFCPCRGARRIGSSQWEPALLLRVQKGINHLMIQGSVWPLPVWGWGSCSSQTACRKVWAERGGKVVW